MSRSSKKLFPGWRMTVEQHGLFWRLWDGACRAQGWSKLSSAERDERRREMLAQLGYASIRDVDSTTGFDRLKARLLELADRVSAEPDDAGGRRRVLYAIGQLLADASEAGYEQAADRICRDRFKIAPGVRGITDLDTPELVNLCRTLKARLASLQQRKHSPATDSHAATDADACTALAHATQTTFSPHAADLGG